MVTTGKFSASRLLVGASAIALGLSTQAAFAQTANQSNSKDKAGEAKAVQASSNSSTAAQKNVIVVTGIRASLRDSMNLKRYAQGVVDAISAEDIGKFPDTNLATALQRITGVSIDRSLGEGSKVTVRGFGPAFNLVLLNGREMPASNIGPGTAPPSSRSFDFANLAVEGVAAVEVYKSGRATLPTGGIGATINIITPKPLDRPGLHGSIQIGGTKDHTFKNNVITPNVSGIISDTFADNKIGILLTGAYQQRRASFGNFTAGWREGYLGSDSTDWGSLPAAEVNGVCNDWRGCNVINHPGPNQVYQTTQNAAYNFTNIKSTRINGMAILQVRPVSNLTATIDYVFSQYTVNSQTDSIGIWYNHYMTQSSWTTQGDAVGPNYYAESFAPGKDLAITGNVAANRNINRSIGGNLKWDGLDGRLHLVVDAHHSTATSKPTSPYGSNIAIGSAIYGVENQRTTYTSAMPVISVSMYPGSEIQASNIRPAGNAFYNAYMRDRINQATFRGEFDFDSSFIESLDFGVTYTDNKVRTAYGFLQNNTWGGTLSAADTPDSLYTPTALPPDLSGMAGSSDPNIIPTYFQIDTVGLINLLRNKLSICASPDQGAPFPGTCLAQYSVDRTIREHTIAPYIQTEHKFTLFHNPAHLRLGLRYERTKIDSTALVPVPTGTVWEAANEIGLIGVSGNTSSTNTIHGEYDNWLPAIDFDFRPVEGVVLRASYSHTITRPNYADMNAGTTIDSPLRPDGGTGATGNPNLKPYLSKNIDLSAEWYHGSSNYISIGYFHKTVTNFIAQTTTFSPEYGLTNPTKGAAVQAAYSALGSNATFDQVKAYVAQNYPNLIDPKTGGILSTPNDPLYSFKMTLPENTDQVAKLSGWEFAIQQNFWNTGFGTLLNYTIVNSDVHYNNGLPFTATQFAVPGVSDSANAVVYYEKHGLQVRVAYNWRAAFLTAYGSDPYYVQAYGQIDANASYDITDHFSVYVQGINITGNSQRGHMRNNQIVYFANPGYARFTAGVRFKF